jgi:hypothetical protein
MLYRVGATTWPYKCVNSMCTTDNAQPVQVLDQQLRLLQADVRILKTSIKVSMY